MRSLHGGMENSSVMLPPPHYIINVLSCGDDGAHIQRVTPPHENKHADGEIDR